MSSIFGISCWFDPAAARKDQAQLDSVSDPGMVLCACRRFVAFCCTRGGHAELFAHGALVSKGERPGHFLVGGAGLDPGIQSFRLRKRQSAALLFFFGGDRVVFRPDQKRGT